MKVIQTKYKGCHFRSRLEARWAVYFDSIGLEWEYEKEGYKFDDGTYYLPDFWLPKVKMWAEVKPTKFNEKEITKAKKLVEGEGYPILKLIGVPELKPYSSIERREDEWIDYAEYVLSQYHNYPQEEGRFYSNPGEPLEDYDYYFPDADIAVIAAKSARFEFGEEGYKK